VSHPTAENRLSKESKQTTHQNNQPSSSDDKLLQQRGITASYDPLKAHPIIGPRLKAREPFQEKSNQKSKTKIK